MKTNPRTRPVQHYISLDIHKAYVLVGGINTQQEMKSAPSQFAAKMKNMAPPETGANVLTASTV